MITGKGTGSLTESSVSKEKVRGIGTYLWGTFLTLSCSISTTAHTVEKVFYNSHLCILHFKNIWLHNSERKIRNSRKQMPPFSLTLENRNQSWHCATSRGSPPAGCIWKIDRFLFLLLLFPQLTSKKHEAESAI